MHAAKPAHVQTLVHRAHEDFQEIAVLVARRFEKVEDAFHVVARRFGFAVDGAVVEGEEPFAGSPDLDAARMADVRAGLDALEPHAAQRRRHGLQHLGVGHVNELAPRHRDRALQSHAHLLRQQRLGIVHLDKLVTTRENLQFVAAEKGTHGSRGKDAPAHARIHKVFLRGPRMRVQIADLLGPCGTPKGRGHRREILGRMRDLNVARARAGAVADRAVMRLVPADVGVRDQTVRSAWIGHDFTDRHFRGADRSDDIQHVDVFLGGIARRRGQREHDDVFQKLGVLELSAHVQASLCFHFCGWFEHVLRLVDDQDAAVPPTLGAEQRRLQYFCPRRPQDPKSCYLDFFFNGRGAGALAPGRQLAVRCAVRLVGPWFGRQRDVLENDIGLFREEDQGVLGVLGRRVARCVLFRRAEDDLPARFPELGHDAHRAHRVVCHGELAQQEPMVPVDGEAVVIALALAHDIESVV